METKKPEGKRNMKMKEVVVEEDEEEEEGEGEGEGEEEEEDEDDDIIVEEENKKKIRALLTPCGVRKVTTSTGSGGSTQQQPSCQVDDCEANLKEAKPYHRRHKVCELHSKAPTVIIAGIRKRFCQQCSRFHDVSEFDEAKRSCRRRLAGHNERRRKTSYDSHGDG